MSHRHFAFAAIRSPFEAVQDVFEAWFARYYHEQWLPEDHALGKSRGGVLKDGMGSFTEQTSALPALTNIFAGDIRLFTIRDRPEWVRINGADGSVLLNDPVADTLARATGQDVFAFACNEGETNGAEHLSALFAVRRPDGTQRTASVEWDEFHGKTGLRFRHRFRQDGQPHRAEDIGSYERRGARNKLPPTELEAIAHRLGLGPVAVAPKDVCRSVIIVETGVGRRLKPSKDAVRAVDQSWPWA